MASASAHGRGDVAVATRRHIQATNLGRRLPCPTCYRGRCPHIGFPVTLLNMHCFTKACRRLHPCQTFSPSSRAMVTSICFRARVNIAGPILFETCIHFTSMASVVSGPCPFQPPIVRESQVPVQKGLVYHPQFSTQRKDYECESEAIPHVMSAGRVPEAGSVVASFSLNPLELQGSSQTFTRYQATCHARLIDRRQGRRWCRCTADRRQTTGMSGNAPPFLHDYLRPQKRPAC